MQTKAFQMLHVVYLVCCCAASSCAHLWNKWLFTFADLYLNFCGIQIISTSQTQSLRGFILIFKRLLSLFFIFIKTELLKTCVLFSPLVWKHVNICMLAFFGQNFHHFFSLYAKITYYRHKLVLWFKGKRLYWCCPFIWQVFLQKCQTFPWFTLWGSSLA